jgi:hypothetical protein
MPLSLKNRFITALLLLYLCQVSWAQQTGKDVREDSVQYVMPTQKNAELKCIKPPICFEPSTAFNGYLCMANGAAIMMHQLDNISYAQAVRGMNEESFQKNGFTLITSFDLHSSHGVKGKVYKLSFKLKNEDYIRYTIFAGNINQTLWLNVTYPKLADDILEVEMLRAFQTITLNPVDNE